MDGPVHGLKSQFPTFILYLKTVFIFFITPPPEYENVGRGVENHIFFQVQDIFLLGDLYYLKARVLLYKKKQFSSSMQGGKA